MRRVPLLGVLLALLLLHARPATSQGPAEAQPDWRGTGVVVAILPPPSSLHQTRPVLIIHHDPIHGLMEEAMDMPFIAASVALFRDLRAGDHIAFGLKDAPDALLVVSVERLGPR